MANNAKPFINNAKKMIVKSSGYVKTMGTKLVDCLTPNKDYSYLPEEDAKVARQFDRTVTKETIIDCCWWACYIIFYAAMIAISIKQQSEIGKEFIEE